MAIQSKLLGVAFIGLIGLVGCTPAVKSVDTGEFPGTERTTLTVENNNWQDMTVYVVRDGMKARLGSVAALGRTQFRLPDAMIGGTGELRLMADPLGSTSRFTTQPIVIMPGQRVRFRLENNVQLSSYFVY